MIFTWSSLSEVPQMEQYLHSMHCHRYRFTEIIMLAVNWRQVGCPDRPQSLQDTSSSAVPVFLFSRASPKQKSQYGDGATLPFSRDRREWSGSNAAAAPPAVAAAPVPGRSESAPAVARPLAVVVDGTACAECITEVGGI